MRRLEILLPVLPVIILALVWEGIARSGVLSDFLLPRLSVVLARIGEDIGEGILPVAILATFYRVLAGFAIAAVLGVSIGIAMAESRAVRWFFEPIISVGFPTPKIAFLPIFMLW